MGLNHVVTDQICPTFIVLTLNVATMLCSLGVGRRVIHEIWWATS
jgi:hypothetical protein